MLHICAPKLVWEGTTYFKSNSMQVSVALIFERRYVASEGNKWRSQISFPNKVCVLNTETVWSNHF